MSRRSGYARVSPHSGGPCGASDGLFGIDAAEEDPGARESVTTPHSTNPLRAGRSHRPALGALVKIKRGGRWVAHGLIRGFYLPGWWSLPHVARVPRVSTSVRNLRESGCDCPLIRVPGWLGAISALGFWGGRGGLRLLIGHGRTVVQVAAAPDAKR